MLSYRHAFHAGNHADIIKHYTLSAVLDYYNRKEKPYCVIDTHAGMYELNHAYPQKNKEFETGISRLISAKHLPDSLKQFVSLVQSFNNTNELNLYPGSPKVAAYYLRPKDQLRLFELHPNEYRLLAKNFKHQSKQTKIVMQDGFSGVKTALPPTTKRGVIIIDPPYEVSDDYANVISTINDSLKRFATGTYLIWYPLLSKREPTRMIETLLDNLSNNWLNVSLNISALTAKDYGMFGSGLFIINPPWTLPRTLNESLPHLVELLGQDNGACFTLESHIR